jgi:molybdenum cofactor guanylyltransferase
VDAQSLVGTGPKFTAAAILAGGGGTRLGGVAKGLLEINGRSIIASQLELLRPLFRRAVIITSDVKSYEQFGVPLIADRFGPGLGPLSGVQTALSSLLADETAVVCVAADMPFLSSKILEALRDYPSADRALVPVVNGFAEPLCARYPRKALADLTWLLEEGRLRMHEALDVIDACRLPEGVWQFFDPMGRFATNINTPQSLSEARAASLDYNGL